MPSKMDARVKPAHDVSGLAQHRMALSLHERAVIETAVEPVLIAGYALLHRDVHVRLVDGNPRNVREREIDEAFDVLLAGLLVADRGGGTGRIDQAVHPLRLVAHGV